MVLQRGQGGMKRAADWMETGDLFGAPDWDNMPLLAGVDEAGRGPLAGPVAAAAVILDPARPVEGLRDSKKLTPEERDALAPLIKERALAWSIALGSVEEIDQINILQSTLRTMVRALEGLSVAPQYVLVDGNRMPPYKKCPVATLVKGDDRVQAISAASILAKTYRDHLVEQYEALYPGYGFAEHKGYGTKEHMEAIRRLGILPVHRKTFEPMASIIREGSAGALVQTVPHTGTLL